MSSQKQVSRQYNLVAQLLRDCDLYDEYIVQFEEAKVDDKLIFAMSVEELAKLFGNSIGDLRRFRQVLPCTASGAFPLNVSDDSQQSSQSDNSQLLPKDIEENSLTQSGNDTVN